MFIKEFLKEFNMIHLRRSNLIVCPGQNIKNNPIECLPLKNFKHKANNGEYSIFEVDGYVINFNNNEPSALLIKYEYNFNDVNEINSNNLINEISKDKFNIENWSNFANIIGLPIFIIVWPYDYPLKTYKLNEPVFFFEIKNNNIIYVQKGDDNTLRAFIRKYRNYAFDYCKNLRVGPSYMNCFLTNKPAQDGKYDPWPGDIDGIIITKDTNKIIAILEFKTHNLNSPIEKEDMNKYSKEDSRRFNVLFYLQKFIGKKQDICPNIFYIIWGTNPDIHKKIKIQVLQDAKKSKEIIIDNDYTVLFNEIEKLISLGKKA